MNRQLLSILSVVFSIAVALGIYLYFSQIEDKNIRPVQIVPDNAAIILESNKSSTHLRNLGDPAFMDRLFSNEKVAGFYQRLQYFDSLLKTNETLAEWFAEGQATYSFHTFENKSVGFFMAVQTQKEVTPENALSFFQTHFPGRYKMNKRKFQNEDLYDFTDFKEGTQFTIAFKSKLMLFSPDGSLVEMGLIKIGKYTNQTQVEDKLSFVKNSGDGLNVYVNFKNLPLLVKGMAHEDYQESFTILGDFAERSVYNIEYDDEELLLKGAAQTHESNFQFLDLLNAQAPIPNTLRAYLPDNLHFAYTFGFNGYNAFFKNANEYLLSRKLFMPYKNYLDSIEKHLQLPFSEKLAAKLGNHAALLAIDEPGLWKDSSYLIAVEVADEMGMDKLLADMEGAVQRKYASDTTLRAPDSLKSDVLKCYLGDGFKFYFTNLFEGISANYFIKSNGYFFFANNPLVLKVYQEHIRQQKTLQNIDGYKEFEQKLAPGSNLEILIMNDHAAKFALHFLNKEWFSLLNQNMGSVKRAQRIGIQFAGSNDKIFATQIYTRFNLSKAEKTEQLWAIPLDSTLIVSPIVVYNASLGIQVILAQDAKNQLYMIDREGKILWKKKLDDKILSGIEELDLFNNGKRQWLFNTAHNIYLIDDLGNNLSGWPAWIPTGTKLPLSVFDLNKDRNYQIFTTGAYFKVTGFNTQGRLLPGWNPKDVWPNWISSVGSLQVGTQSVFWSLNEKGKISILNTQAKPVDWFKLDSNYQFIAASIEQVDTGQLRILALDSTNFYQINWFNTKAPSIRPQACVGFESFKKVDNGSGSPLYLFSGKSKVAIMGENGNLVLSKNFMEDAPKDAQWTFIGNGYKLIYSDAKTGMLHVENAKQEAYKPFPMPVNGAFAIGNLFKEADNWLLFTDGQNRLNLYRIK